MYFSLSYDSSDEEDDYVYNSEVVKHSILMFELLQMYKLYIANLEYKKEIKKQKDICLSMIGIYVTDPHYWGNNFYDSEFWSGDDISDCTWDQAESEPDWDLSDEYSDTSSDASSVMSSSESSSSEEDSVDDHAKLFHFIESNSHDARVQFDNISSYFDTNLSFEDFRKYLYDINLEIEIPVYVLVVLAFFEKEGCKLRTRSMSGNFQSDFIPVASALRKFIGLSSCDDSEELISFFEDVMTFMYMCMYGHDSLKIRGTIAITVFIKLRSKKSIYSSAKSMINDCNKYMEELFSEQELQSDSDFFSQAGNLCDRYEEMSASPIFNKLYKLTLFMISLCLFKTMGIEFDKFNYFKIEREALLSNMFKGPDFVFAFLKTILFVCKRGYQCMITGTLDPLYHSGDRYEQWMENANDLKRKSKFLNNPSAHGFSKFEFLHNLNEAIEQGECMYKHAVRIGQFERKFVSSMLNELKIIKATELTKKAAMQTRKVPFSILLSGGSKVAKSQLTDLLFMQYGKLFDLPITSEYKYTRSFTDEYWTNFDSSQWCLQMDDIAFLHPQVAPQGDATVMEMLQVVNNVPYVPPQAAIEDKGKNPVLSKFVIATTNVAHLNALQYFNNELAVRRRLPFVVDVEPKTEYSSDGTTIDPRLLPLLEEGDYPDFWRLTVKRVVAHNNNVYNQRATFKTLFVTESIYEFIQWFNKQAKEHDEIQDRALKCKSDISNVVVCNTCKIPLKHCVCNNECFVCNNVICVCETQSGFVRYVAFSFIYYTIVTWMHLLRYIPYLENSAYGIRITLWCILMLRDSEQVSIMRNIGDSIHRRIGKYPFFLKIIGIIACGSITYNILKSFIISRNESKEEKALQNDGAPLTDRERKNPWVPPSYEVTSFDYNHKSLSYKALSVEDLKEKILNNCISILFQWEEDGKPLYCRTHAFCIKGHIYMINTHALKFSGHVRVCIVQSIKQNVDNNTSCLMHRNEFCALDLNNDYGSDISTFQLLCLPPKKDMLDLFVRKSFNGVFNGFYLYKDYDGVKQEMELKSIKRKGYVRVLAANIIVDAWSAQVNKNTQVGDCGAIAVSMTQLGPVIVGMHMVGGIDHKVGIQSANFEEITNHISRYGVQFEPSIVNLESEISNMELNAGLHWKSEILQIEEGTCNVYGSMRGYGGSMKSAVMESILKEPLKKYGINNTHVAPNFADKRAWHLQLKSIFTCKNAFDYSILKMCADAYINDIKTLLPENEWKLMQILDDVTSVNGKPGVTFIDAINKNTSMGYPWRKSKRYFLKPLDCPQEGQEDFVQFDESFYEKMRDMEYSYRSGKLNHPIFYAHQKDEPISQSKADRGKIRLFTGANCVYSMLVRKHFLTFVRVFQRNPYIFEGAPGMVCQSLEWEKLREYLTQFNTDCLIDGDFENYDKNVMAMFVKMAFYIIISLQNYAGQGDTIVREGLAEDTAYPYVILKGDLLQFFNMLCSGIPLTVIINCIVNSLYMRYCYYVIFHKVHDFKKFVALMTYGDDNTQNVHRSISEQYNHVTIANILRNHGINYTMADKNSNITPFRNISQVSFLKRMFRWDTDIGAFVAPLEKESIYKMLSINLVSKTISREETAVACISSALREFFFYGKEEFQKWRAILLNVATEVSILQLCDDTTFPTYESLLFNFWDNSKDIEIKRPVLRLISTSRGVNLISKPKEESTIANLFLQTEIGVCKKSVPIVGYIHQGVPRSIYLNRFRYIGRNTINHVDGISQTQREYLWLNKFFLNSNNAKLGHYKLQADSATPSLRGASGNTNSTTVRNNTSLRGAASNRNGATRAAQNESPNPRIDDNGAFEETNPSEGGAGYQGHRISELSETVRFVDDSIQDLREYDIVNDSDSLADTTDGNDLANFLSRPVQLGAFSWASTGVAGDSLMSFNPWNDFLANTNISRKLEGWAFLRGNLKLKFLTNASPFLYGAARVGYTPLQNIRPANYTFTTSPVLSLIPFSQLPGAYIYPQANQGCELSLPFFSLANMLDVRNTVPLTIGRIRAQDLGTLDVRIYAPLRSANGVAAPTTSITVYAWMENVVLSGPTLAQPLQARDEYGTGSISKNASAIATAAKALRNVPIIGPYATATALGATAVAKSAAAFGYTNVPVIDDSKPVRSHAFPQLATTEIGYPIEKLTLDPKNELTIDPHVVGLNSKDELEIRNLVTKESYLTSFNWVDNELVEANKFLTAIGPHACLNANNTDVASNVTIACTPVAMISHLFNNWRGGMYYRFQVIGTKFHKGRLRISYDPTGSPTTNLITNAGPYDERVVTTIIDLEGDTDVEFYVPYQQATSWMDSRRLTQNYPTVNTYWQTSGFSYAAINNNQPNNGCLNVRILTPLTGPVTPTTIQVLVYVRAAEDFEFANPAVANANISCFPMQADDGNFNAMQIGEDECEEVVAGTVRKTPVDTRYLVYMGEHVVSLRQYMRRMTYVGSHSLGFAATNRHIWYNRLRIPQGPGPNPSASKLARNLANTANIAYSWEQFHVIPYIGSCFLLWRGSVNWSIHLENTAAPTHTTRLLTSRHYTPVSNPTLTASNVINATSDTQIQRSIMDKNFFDNRWPATSGATVTDGSYQPALNALAPCYSKFKGLPSHPRVFANPEWNSNSFYSGDHGIQTEVITQASVNYVINEYAGIGTDFGFHFFLCVPLMYMYTSPAAPA